MEDLDSRQPSPRLAAAGTGSGPPWLTWVAVDLFHANPSFDVFLLLMAALALFCQAAGTHFSPTLAEAEFMHPSPYPHPSHLVAFNTSIDDHSGGV